MYDEYNALVKNGTWLLVPRPTSVTMVHSMWLFKHKFHVDGTLSHYKARLVANGSSQQLGVDFDETFSSVVKPATIRTVHSLVVSPSCPALLQQIIGSLNNEFDMTDLEALNYVIGISADRTPTESKLGSEVQQICLFMHDPREPHLAALKRILRYVQGTLDLGLHLYASSTTSLVGYTDADWEGFPSTRSAKAEYRGVANVVAETVWLRNLLCELHSLLSTATLVIVITLVLFICLPILFKINERNTLRSIFISSEIWLSLVRLEFYMCPLVFNMPIFSPSDCLPHCLKNFDPV
nr:ribonuclease H-like domain-containing protein [Tanacetum cinerariifolium]